MRDRSLIQSLTLMHSAVMYIHVTLHVGAEYKYSNPYTQSTATLCYGVFMEFVVLDDPIIYHIYSPQM